MIPSRLRDSSVGLRLRKSFKRCIITVNVVTFVLTGFELLGVDTTGDGATGGGSLSDRGGTRLLMSG
jgi:hypothetical protein